MLNINDTWQDVAASSYNTIRINPLSIGLFRRKRKKKSNKQTNKKVGGQIQWQQIIENIQIII